MAKVSSKCLPSDAAAPLGAEAMTCMHPVSPPPWDPPSPSKPAWTQTARKAGLCGVTPLLGIGVLGDASTHWPGTQLWNVLGVKSNSFHAPGCVQGFPSPVSQTARQAVVCHSRAAGSERRTRLAGEVCLSGLLACREIPTSSLGFGGIRCFLAEPRAGADSGPSESPGGT